MKSSELNQRRQQATPRGVGVMCSYFVEKAENATLWDIEGNEVIDFAAGIAVLNTGHRHPKIVAAVEQQLQAFTPIPAMMVWLDSSSVHTRKDGSSLARRPRARPIFSWSALVFGSTAIEITGSGNSIRSRMIG